MTADHFSKSIPGQEEPGNISDNADVCSDADVSDDETNTSGNGDADVSGGGDTDASDNGDTDAAGDADVSDGGDADTSDGTNASGNNDADASDNDNADASDNDNGDTDATGNSDAGTSGDGDDADVSDGGDTDATGDADVSGDNDAGTSDDGADNTDASDDGADNTDVSGDTNASDGTNASGNNDADASDNDNADASDDGDDADTSDDDADDSSVDFAADFGRHLRKSGEQHVPTTPVSAFEVSSPQDAEADAEARARAHVEEIFLQVEDDFTEEWAREKAAAEAKAAAEVEAAKAARSAAEAKLRASAAHDSALQELESHREEQADLLPKVAVGNKVGLESRSDFIRTMTDLLPEIPEEEFGKGSASYGGNASDVTMVVHRADEALESTTVLKRLVVPYEPTMRQSGAPDRQVVSEDHGERLSVELDVYPSKDPDLTGSKSTALAGRSQGFFATIFAAIGAFFARLFHLDD